MGHTPTTNEANVRSINGESGDITLPVFNQMIRPQDFDLTVGDGGDATAAFVAMRNAIMASRIPDPDAGPGFLKCTKNAYIPPGEYLITSPGALMDDTGDAPGTGTFGYEVFGAGESTRIIYHPTSTGPLFRNLNQFFFPVVRRMTFVGFPLGDANRARATCAYSASNSGVAGWTWEDVTWWLAWNAIDQLDAFAGTANGNDSHHFRRCNVQSASMERAIFDSGLSAGVTNQDQAIAHTIDACDFHLERQGDIVRLAYGGHLTVTGGSMIINGSGNGAYAGGKCFNIPDSGTHNLGTCHLRVDGTRFEIRSVGKVIDCHWQFGTVKFSNCSTDGYPFVPANQILATFDPSANTGPLVTWDSCALAGQHEYVYYTNDYLAGPHKATYRSCQIDNYRDPPSFIVNTEIIQGGAGSGTVGNSWLIDFDQCRGLATYGVGGDAWGRSFRSVANWRHAFGAIVKPEYYSVKTSYGVLPQNGAALPFWLPLGAIIVGFHDVMPAKTGSAATAWTHALTDANALSLYSYAPGTAHNLGYENHPALANWIFLDTDNKRHLTLTVTGVDDSSTKQLFLIQFLPGDIP